MEKYDALLQRIETLKQLNERAKMDVVTAEANLKQYETQKKQIQKFCKDNNYDINKLDEIIVKKEAELTTMIQKAEQLFKDAGYDTNQLDSNEELY